ncbi:hypothetical protein GCM10028806_16240 [Spirosoma terrae]|uniref:TMF family protein n=1 Tax=Spirosoma terrae TaxID=1968276 RepID=A0A6L9L7F6_9BACT|nr:hypothetical protein [Spirosoma terrae]NDU95272.1 hypothetical protein [Spirosoma terrae]
MNKSFYLLSVALFSFSYQLKAQGLPSTSYIVNSANTAESGGFNTFVGPEAGRNNAGGYDNAFVGYQAGLNNSLGAYNTFMGFYAGKGNTSGNFNTFIGADAGLLTESGGYNSFYGAETGLHNKAHYNSFLGAQAGWTNTTGTRNDFVGFRAGYLNTTGANNSFHGHESGYNNVTGGSNVYVGFQAGYNALSDFNTFVGFQAGFTNTTGQGNTFFGILSGRGNVTGNHNTYIGNGTGPASNNSDDNVYIGFNTGNHDSGSRNTLLGTGADAIAQNLTNATAIGAGATVAISDAVILGNQASVGIGTSAPTARLEVNSGMDNESGVRLSRLTANSPVQLATTDKLLTVDATGKLVLTSAGHYSVRSEADWSDKVFMNGYKLRSLSEVDQYIQKHQHLPGVPSAAEIVEQGIDAAKMDAKLLEKIEELTLYSIQLEKDKRQQQAISQKQQAEIDELKRLVKQLLERK